MTDSEFDGQAAAIGAKVLDADRDRRIAPHERFAAACRGSANPAALAWLAENLRLHPESAVVDLGSGLGGPSSWLAARYGCVVVGLEPAPAAAETARTLFSSPVVNASSTHAPFRADAFDAALLLGVLSVVADQTGVLREARRIGRTLGVLDYCSTTADDVHAGGSRFVPLDGLEHSVAASGWRVEQASTLGVDAPRSWADAAEEFSVPPLPDEAEVAAAIERGAIAPVVLIASR